MFLTATLAQVNKETYQHRFTVCWFLSILIGYSELVNQSELLNMSIACNNAETCFRGVVPGPLLFEAQAFIF